jgi:predicted nucleic acid-binding protein
MSDAYLLDSSVLVEVLRHRRQYEERLEQVTAAYISSVGLGDLSIAARFIQEVTIKKGLQKSISLFGILLYCLSMPQLPCSMVKSKKH